MTVRHLDGAPPLAITLRRSARARRITLRVNALDARVTLTLPNHVSERDALAFAAEKEGWIRTHLARRTPRALVGFGSDLPVEGVMRRIVPGAGRQVILEDDVLYVPGAADRAGARVQGFVKALARDRCAAAADMYASRLGRSYTRLSLRDTRSRWGSCTSAGHLMLSWRLILAPSDVLNYVVAHEVAHLAEMNHGPNFWDRVQQIHGPYDHQKIWLRENGSRLHSFRFTD